MSAGVYLCMHRARPLSDEERRFVELNHGLVGNVIRRWFRPYVARRPGAEVGEDLLTYQDLFDTGVFGLIEALDRWDPRRGSFSTCATEWIRNKIQLYVSTTLRAIRVPKHVRVRAKTSAVHARRIAVAGKVLPLEAAEDSSRDGRRHDEDAFERRELFLRAYTVPVDGDLERLGRFVVVRLAGVDGSGFSPRHREEALAELGAVLGRTRGELRAAADAFLRRARGCSTGLA